jgi:hypothetical protein
MLRRVATALGIFVAVFTLTEGGSAQSVVQVQGVLQSVDCRANTVAVKMQDGVHVFPASRYTAVFVDSTSVGLCGLSRFIGRTVAVSVTASDNQLLAGRIDVLGAAPAPAAPAPAPPYHGPYPPYTSYYDAGPYCYPAYPGPYYGPPPFCPYGPYGWYYPYPYYYVVPGISIGIVFGPRHFVHRFR